jgi:hypothetical protein
MEKAAEIFTAFSQNYFKGMPLGLEGLYGMVCRF